MVGEGHLIQYWRGHVVPKPDFTPSNFSNCDNVQSVGDPLIQIVPDESSPEISVQAAYFLICPLDESRRGSL